MESPWIYAAITIFLLGAIASAQSSSNLVTMPDLIGRTQDEANETLNNLGLTPSYFYEFSETVDREDVISQQPCPGKNISHGENVSVFISMGYIVKIDNLNDSEFVGSTVIVTGTVTSLISEEDNLWIVVRPLSSPNNYWPQTGGPLAWDRRHKNFDGVAFLGGKNDDNLEISVLVLNNSISDAFSKYIEACSERNDWPPITKEGLGYQKLGKKIIDKEKLKGDSVRVILKI